MLKRYEDNELGESASRRVSYHCTAEYAKSSKAKCRVCNKNIAQNELRLALMLQDDEGYKNTAWTHFTCFWKHPETRKLDGVEEIHNFSNLKAEDQEKISTAFEELNSKKSPTKKTHKRASKTATKKTISNDDEDLSTKSKSAARKVTTKNPTSNKRKRTEEDN